MRSFVYEHVTPLYYALLVSHVSPFMKAGAAFEPSAFCFFFLTTLSRAMSFLNQYL